MQADWAWGLGGGLIIGLAAAMYLMVNGRVMGASGIIGGLVDGSGRSTAMERMAFVAGLVLAPLMAVSVRGAAPEIHLTSNVGVLVCAGLLVGLGTRLANGCTSGHGVCGISRLSPRGLVATMLYLLAGALSVLVFRHLLGVI